MSDAISLDVSEIQSWRSIIILIVFILTNLVVLFPFHVTVYVPTALVRDVASILRRLRVIPPRQDEGRQGDHDDTVPGSHTCMTPMRFPLNFITAPLIADLFLLAILAIGRQEVYDGTVGSNNILPIDIMVFFLTLAYIAISIDASGLIRYLAFRVLRWGGKVGHRLFFYLYAFFFLLGSFIGNDPIILSGTAFLAYMTRVSDNIEHPRAWIHTQFAVANTASAILVSSNPTNLVLAGAFNIKFIVYTANMIIPVVVTGIVLFPCLLYNIFATPSLIPSQIKMRDLPEYMMSRKPVNPNIPNARGKAGQLEKENPDNDAGRLLLLEEIMNPFLDKGGATFGAVIMTATLVTVLALNAVSQGTGEHPVFWVTLPAAFVMFCWDVAYGWTHREETREIARKGRAELENERLEKLVRETGKTPVKAPAGVAAVVLRGHSSRDDSASRNGDSRINDTTKDVELTEIRPAQERQTSEEGVQKEEDIVKPPSRELQANGQAVLGSNGKAGPPAEKDVESATQSKTGGVSVSSKELRTLVSVLEDWYRWCQETFPTVTAVLAHLPFALVPFALSMFVLVEALVTKGWVPVFAYGWDHWVDKTGTVGAIGGMAFLSVILCNFAGTNIGTTILLSRVVQAWQEIHRRNGILISDRTFWATVYSMALGVNYGAYSTAFNASLAGLLWRDILARKHITVPRLEFARVNLPIIAIAMSVGCAVLAGEVYIIRSDTTPYSLG